MGESMDSNKPMTVEERERAKDRAWESIDLGIKILIGLGTDPLYLIKVLVSIVRDKKEGEA
jgi:hypothetical protein